MITPRLLHRLAVLLILAPAPARAQATAPAAKAADATRPDEVITLSPFEVAADPTDTYEAYNTNSVTGTNTPLSRTPLEARVFNRQMLDELGTIDMTEMLWKIGGLGPASIGAGEEYRGTLGGDRQDPKSMSMRGGLINNPRRDGFLRSETTLLDSFDVERVEAIGGSNSLLFGAGSEGGVVNAAPNAPTSTVGPPRSCALPATPRAAAAARSTPRPATGSSPCASTA
jgi:outer membrane receptor protein involved in Fe transport